MSVAPSVALVSERNANQSTPSPQVHPSVAGDQDPAAALWGNQQYTKARWDSVFNVTLFAFEQIQRSNNACAVLLRTSNFRPTRNQTFKHCRSSAASLQSPNPTR